MSKVKNFVEVSAVDDPVFEELDNTIIVTEERRAIKSLKRGKGQFK